MPRARDLPDAALRRLVERHVRTDLLNAPPEDWVARRRRAHDGDEEDETVAARLATEWGALAHPPVMPAP
jgi:hypothetical protein